MCVAPVQDLDAPSQRGSSCDAMLANSSAQHMCANGAGNVQGCTHQIATDNTYHQAASLRKGPQAPCKPPSHAHSARHAVQHSTPCQLGGERQAAAPYAVRRAVEQLRCHAVLCMPCSLFARVRAQVPSKRLRSLSHTTAVQVLNSHAILTTRQAPLRACMHVQVHCRTRCCSAPVRLPACCQKQMSPNASMRPSQLRREDMGVEQLHNSGRIMLASCLPALTWWPANHVWLQNTQTLCGII